MGLVYSIIGYYSYNVRDIQPSPSFDRLKAIHPLILRHLSLISPLKTLTLSSEHYQQTLPVLYRDIDVSDTIFRPLHDVASSPAHQRALDAFFHVKILRIPDWQGIQALLSLVEFFSPYGLLQPPPKDERLFACVEKVEIGWKVLKQVHELEHQEFGDHYDPKWAYLGLATLLGGSFSDLIIHMGADEMGHPFNTAAVVNLLAPRNTTYVAHGSLGNPVYLTRLGEALSTRWPGAEAYSLILYMEEDFYDPETKESHSIHDDYVYPTSLAIHKHTRSIVKGMERKNSADDGTCTAKRADYHIHRPRNVQITMASHVKIQVDDSESLGIMDAMEHNMVFAEYKEDVWEKLQVTKGLSDDYVPKRLAWSTMMSNSVNPLS